MISQAGQLACRYDGIWDMRCTHGVRSTPCRRRKAIPRLYVAMGPALAFVPCCWQQRLARSPLLELCFWSQWKPRTHWNRSHLRVGGSSSPSMVATGRTPAARLCIHCLRVKRLCQFRSAGRPENDGKKLTGPIIEATIKVVRDSDKFVGCWLLWPLMDCLDYIGDSALSRSTPRLSQLFSRLLAQT
jgi:hypothetical protein